MRKIFEISFVALAVMVMTTLSLLPHHHHGCTEAICLMPQYCGHADECSHLHGDFETDATSHNGEEHCSIRVIDMSIGKSTEVLTPDIQSFNLFLNQPEVTELCKAELSGFYDIEKSERIVTQYKGPLYGLRAPPVSRC